jgi:HlyD family secretion protein
MAISLATIDNMYDSVRARMKFSKLQLLWAIPLLMLATGCGDKENDADAFGNFEAREVTVASETAGRLLQFSVEEGQELTVGHEVGIVDTTQISLQLDELAARRRQVGTRTSNVVAQMDVVKQQIEVLTKERMRVEKLVQAGAATTKQLDDIDGQLKVLVTQRQSINAQNLPVANEIEAIDVQGQRLRDQLRRSHIVNPVKGRVLVKLAEATEVVAPGRPLYRIAPMDSLYLRAYMSGGQLAEVKLGQIVTVRIDNGEGGYFKYNGKVTWIADQAEFTPKIVQTKEERVNLVYAFKVMVHNDGKLKIGMPGEVKFDTASNDPASPTTADNK